jgi:ribosomal protein S18 acetylase RimI-like enzyme
MTFMHETSAPSFQIRPIALEDAALVAKVHIDTWRATYPGIMPQTVLDGLSHEALTARWQKIGTPADVNNTIAAFVAEADRTIVGFGVACEQRDDTMREAGFSGEFATIHILPSYQGAGLGRRLMAVMARSMLAEGHVAASCWSATENHPACRFYERLGGEAFSEKIDKRLDMNLHETGYVWRDIRALAQMGQGSG